MAYPGTRIPETPLIGSSTTIAATIADRGMDKSPCNAPAFSAVDSRTVTTSRVTVMVGICLVLHLDGRHRSTVGMAYNTLPLMFEQVAARCAAVGLTVGEAGAHGAAQACRVGSGGVGITI